MHSVLQTREKAIENQAIAQVTINDPPHSNPDCTGDRCQETGT